MYTAVVTGASGYIGTELVSQLLAKGYNVRGTVRDVDAHDKTAHLTALGGALPGKLTLHNADLLKEGSFDAVVKDADYVFHTASPFFLQVEDAQRDLVDPAVKGTRNVLSAVAKTKETIKGVVLTSSFAAVVKPEAGPGNGKLYTESDWNNESSLTNSPYRFSKTEAEKAAWELSTSHGFSLVTINPTFVLGPVIGSRADATSILAFKAFIENTGADLMAWQADVRDIAKAHILAAEVPTANGRYIVAHGSTISTRTVSDVLSKRFPHFKFPPGKDEPFKEVIDNTKVQKELGLQLTDPAFTYIDMAATLIQRGIAKPVPKHATKEE